MKGIIFNLLEQVVSDERGDDAWDALLDSTGLDGVYTSLGNYPDAELIKLIHAAAALLSRTPEDVLRLFGAKAIPLLAQRYPVFFEGHQSARTFLLTLNDVIHPEVRKLYPGADVPDFSYETKSDDALTMIYASPRRFCAFAEGLIAGTATHFAQRVDVAQPECMHRGDARCVFRLSFAPAPLA